VSGLIASTWPVLSSSGSWVALVIVRLGYDEALEWALRYLDALGINFFSPTLDADLRLLNDANLDLTGAQTSKRGNPEPS
jgi:hypothetical protein